MGFWGLVVMLVSVGLLLILLYDDCICCSRVINEYYFVVGFVCRDLDIVVEWVFFCIFFCIWLSFNLFRENGRRVGCGCGCGCGCCYLKWCLLDRCDYEGIWILLWSVCVFVCDWVFVLGKLKKGWMCMWMWMWVLLFVMKFVIDFVYELWDVYVIGV